MDGKWIFQMTRLSWCNCSHGVRALLELTEHGCASLLGENGIQTAPQKKTLDI